MKFTDKKNPETILTELENFHPQFIQSSQRIMEAGNSKLFTLDFLALSVNNRAISLINSYVTLVKSKNYLTAVSLIRLQLDNALRFFASTLVENSNEFAMHFIDGKPIKDYEDINGKKLSDNYLAKKLDVYFNGTQKLYNDTCGYIHLSDKHFFPTVSKKKREDLKFGIQIGSSDNFRMDDKFKFTNTMLEVSKLVLIVVEQWKHEKIKLSEIHDKQNVLK
ncbi:hypothetical protein [Aequorivita antarctica]|uniref:Uncharacterized protein n=1 Tax=Aequorivita antarctica TaxID=153266 RepID=A0A5C6Z0S7_9FLAO|nr:hypothetical protein [Aequorivita antarctica]TXD73572.1 hypothetical protein ESU54_07355 [Aequorivita antarctica]SRX75011.1 hypothetical protein AEQU3_01998 [Aequorivita antarctica]